MPLDYLSPSWWYAAMYLRERGSNFPNVSLHSDPEMAERRFQRWVRTPAFLDPFNLIHFLECQEVDAPAFRAHLSDLPPSFPSKIECPSWAVEFNRAIISHETQTTGRPIDRHGFLSLVEPIVDSHIVQLGTGISALNATWPSALIETSVLDSLSEGLREQMLALIIRPLVLEFNIAQAENSLAGSTSKEHLDSFRGRLTTSAGRCDLFSHYPALARYCYHLCQQWLAAGREFLERVCSDRSRLSTLFDYTDVGPLVSAQISGGDTHQHGRHVLIAEFQCGLRVVYKPRPLAASERFQSFLAWLNARGQHPKLRCLKILDRGCYGWSEYVETGACSSVNEVEQFYQRQGALLAVLYCLGGTDCHYQNVIASGADPVLVDVETLFQPRVVAPIVSPNPDAAAQEVLIDSVMGTGLLPEPSVVAGTVVDLSGLGATSSTTSALETIGLQQSETGKLHTERIGFRIEEAPNRPKLDNHTVSLGDFLPQLETGFSSAYNLLLRNQVELQSQEGPVNVFDDVPVRVVLRPTATYSSLLSESLHPQALRDAAERERILAQIWLQSAVQPYLRRVVCSEYKQLLEGDIPYFTSTPASIHVTSGHGCKISNVLTSCGRTIVENRIIRLGTMDLKRQLWFIRASVSSLTENTPRYQVQAQCIPEKGKETYGDAATAIGERLVQTAVHGSDGVSWLSLLLQQQISTSPKPHYKIGLVDSDLYDGLAGISLFLAYLGNAMPERGFEDTARRALITLENRFRDNSNATTQLIGAFNGLGGLIYLYSHLGHLWNDQSMLNKAASLLPIIADSVDGDRSLDIIAGSAGCVLCLLSLFQCSSNSRAVELAVSCGEHLIKALKENSCLDRNNRGELADPISLRYTRGFSHGLSGIAWALAALWRETGERHFLDFSQELIARERKLIAVEQWTDPDEPSLHDQASWCHGAPGIALSRLATYEITKDSSLRLDAEYALERASKSSDLGNHSLCHGDVGNLEPFVLASKVLPENPVWPALTQMRATAILNDIMVNGCRSARPGYTEVPGLMTGIAGVGLGMLRQMNPIETPNVLLLHPPKKSTSK